MAEVIWGVDFGSWSLKVARGVYDKRAGTITCDLLEEIPYGDLPCGYDASPLEKQREGVIALRQRHDIRSRDALCVCVTGSEVFSRFINLPPVPESIDRIIRYEAGQQIPFDLNDVIWDYQQVKERPEPGEEIEVGLFALKKGRVQELLDMLEPWRDSLRIVQNAPLAVYNLLEYEGLVEQPLIVMDVGATTTDVLALNPPRFWVRSLLVAGNDITNALVENFGVSTEEAEKIKRRLDRSTHRQRVMDVLNPVFDEVSNEIQRTLGYYKSLARDVKFERILLMGDAARMQGLREMLAKRLRYRFQTIGGLNRIQLDPSVDAQETRNKLPGFAAALGLLVQGAGEARVNINMVPDEIALTTELSRKKPWLAAAGVAILVFFGLLWLGQRLEAQEIRQPLEEVDWGPVEEIQAEEKQYEQLMEEVEELRDSPLAHLAEPAMDRDFYMQMLAQLSRSLPRDVYLVSLAFNWHEPPMQEQEEEEEDDLLAGLGAPEGMAMPEEGGWPSMLSPLGRGGARIGGAGRGGEEYGEWMERYLEQRAAAQERRQTARGAEGLPGLEGLEGLEGVGGVGEAEKMKRKLVLQFSAESRRITKGRQFVEKQVLETLRDLQMPGDPTKKAFTEVGLLVELHDVKRSVETPEGQPVPGATEHFAGFEVYAVVNLDLEPVPRTLGAEFDML